MEFVELYVVFMGQNVGKEWSHSVANVLELIQTARLMAKLLNAVNISLLEMCLWHHSHDILTSNVYLNEQ